MERALTEQEMSICHQHECGDCGSMAARRCFCEDGSGNEFARCVHRAPGERNPQCPSLAGVGKENLTQVMIAENEAVNG
jgi:hypothetical protein